jgi:hypothetical protein
MGVAVAVAVAGRGEGETTGDGVATDDAGAEQPARKMRIRAAGLRGISRKTRRPDPRRGGAAGAPVAGSLGRSARVSQEPVAQACPPLIKDSRTERDVSSQA